MNNRILFATTEAGESLPIIDITNPAFAVEVSDHELATMTNQFLSESAQRREINPPLQEALQQSTLGRGLMAAAGSFLDAITTYRLKLGPENLWPNPSPIDRGIAASFPAFTSRLRLQDMAQLIAEGLSSTLATQPQRKGLLINIGGGAASDTWNALLHLRAHQPALLSNRQIVIAVLDKDDAGPAFGARAIDALRDADAPLHGIDITFLHYKYDWTNIEELLTTLHILNASEAACAICSEGGLFEYGSDEEIRSNLEALHAQTPIDARVSGSVTRDSEPTRASQAASSIRTHPRTIEAFTSLAEISGWKLLRAIERPFSFHVSLAKL